MEASRDSRVAEESSRFFLGADSGLTRVGSTIAGGALSSGLRAGPATYSFVADPRAGGADGAEAAVGAVCSCAGDGAFAGFLMGCGVDLPMAAGFIARFLCRLE